MRQHSSCISQFLVLRRLGNDPFTFAYGQTLRSFRTSLKTHLVSSLYSRQSTLYPSSLNIFPSLIRHTILKLSPDILHFHWIGNEVISLQSLLHLSMTMPVVHTLHDTWLLNRNYHHQVDCPLPGRPFLNPFVSLSSYLKSRLIPRLSLIAPSNFIRHQIESSTVQPLCTYLLPNPLDTDIYCPREHNSTKKPTILFVSSRNLYDPSKGFDRLLAALRHLSLPLSLLVVGSSITKLDLPDSVDYSFLPYVQDDLHMSRLYSLATITCVPSFIESLPQVATESISCGTPVVGFRHTGLTDVVFDGFTGILADPYCSVSLSKAILKCIHLRLDTSSVRSFAVSKWSTYSLAPLFEDMYGNVLDNSLT